MLPMYFSRRLAHIFPNKMGGLAVVAPIVSLSHYPAIHVNRQGGGGRSMTMRVKYLIKIKEEERDAATHNKDLICQ